MIGIALVVLLAGGLVTEMTPERISEAEQWGALLGKIPTGTALRTIDIRRDWEVRISTPFGRVAEMARVAAARLEPFSFQGVDADSRERALAPVFEVVVAIRPPAKIHDERAAVERVVVAPRGSVDIETVTQPLWSRPISQTYSTAIGAKREIQSLIAAFPLSALSATNDVVVIVAGGTQVRIPITESLLAAVR